MLFGVIYTPRGDVSEESGKRVLQLFANWTLPAGYEIKSHYAFADGSGGIILAEVSTAAAAYESAAPWGPFFEFKIAPIVDIAESLPILQKVHAWRDSVR